MSTMKRIMICRWTCSILMLIWLAGSCQTRMNRFHVKARTSKELKIHAFERCGRHYRIIAYEDDTANIECFANN